MEEASTSTTKNPAAPRTQGIKDTTSTPCTRAAAKEEGSTTRTYSASTAKGSGIPGASAPTSRARAREKATNPGMHLNMAKEDNTEAEDGKGSSTAEERVEERRPGKVEEKEKERKEADSREATGIKEDGGRAGDKIRAKEREVKECTA